MDRFVLVAASKNRKKLAELAALLAHLPLRIATIDDVRPDARAPEETGVSFEENSALKALYYADLCGALCLADDSGLEVDALAGAPGVYSSRFGGEEGNDDLNNAALIARLAGVPAAQRGAQYRCVLTLAAPGRVLLRVEGSCRGEIIDQPRGRGGFGYDPYFHDPALGRTFAELEPEEKAAVSHRGRALRQLIERLPAVLERENLVS